MDMLDHLSGLFLLNSRIIHRRTCKLQLKRLSLKAQIRTSIALWPLKLIGAAAMGTTVFLTNQRQARRMRSKICPPMKSTLPFTTIPHHIHQSRPIPQTILRSTREGVTNRRTNIVGSTRANKKLLLVKRETAKQKGTLILRKATTEPMTMSPPHLKRK